MTKVLIIGGSGYLGHTIFKELNPFYDVYGTYNKNIDFKNKLIYISLLSIIHHTVLFSLEIFDFSKLLFSIDKIIMSSFFTISLCFLFSYLFKTNER